jgi:hypothetical protein
MIKDSRVALLDFVFVLLLLCSILCLYCCCFARFCVCTAVALLVLCFYSNLSYGFDVFSVTLESVAHREI